MHFIRWLATVLYTLELQSTHYSTGGGGHHDRVLHWIGLSSGTPCFLVFFERGSTIYQ